MVMSLITSCNLQMLPVFVVVIILYDDMTYT